MAVFHKQREEGPDRVDQEKDDGCCANGEEHDAAAHVGEVEEGGGRIETNAHTLETKEEQEWSSRLQ